MEILPLNERILPLAEDYVFKAVLTHPNAKPALMDLISAVIGRNVEDVSIRNNELPSTDTEEKNQRLDVNCVIDDGSQVNVEMQGSKTEGLDGGRKTLINKSIYYLTDLHSTQPSKGIKYEDLVSTYQITFCTYNIFDSNGYITYASLRTDTGLQISDQVHLIFIELSKLDNIINKSIDEMTPIEMWSAFLAYSADPAKRKLLNKVLSRKEAIAMAGTVLAEISKDEHERAKRMSQRKWETDMQNNYLVGKDVGKAEGKAEGIAEGITKGKAEGKAAIAKKLKNMGTMSNAQIAELTELSIKEIEKL